MSWWISVIAPTSTPRVGSSKMISSGSWTSDLEITSFCWLPPESSIAFTSWPMARIARRLIQRMPTSPASFLETSVRLPRSLASRPR